MNATTTVDMTPKQVERAQKREEAKLAKQKAMEVLKAEKAASKEAAKL